jgi:NAD(P)-dependent dehydrogenase (short-subunit alcohol dehydrogenase family)
LIPLFLSRSERICAIGVRLVMESNGEVVVITGGTAGVGRATARRFASSGAKVAVLARGKDGLEGTKNDIERVGSQALALEVDVSDAKAVDQAASRIEADLGPIDIWVNNAMTAVFSPTWDMEPDEYKRVTEVTYLGQVYGTLAALKRMRPRNRGSIVLVGSALAYRGIPLQSSYCAAKHAIQGFADSLRAELMHEKSKILLTMVQLPGVNTPQFSWVKSRMPRHPKPMGACYQPEVPAEAIYWAAHHKRRELMVAMPTVEAIYGNKLFPELGDWFLSKVGFSGQQTDEKVDPNRPNNLYEPLPGDFGAHGIFDEQAKPASPQLWSTLHRRKALGVSLGIAGLAFGIWQLGRKR